VLPERMFQECSVRKLKIQEFEIQEFELVCNPSFFVITENHLCGNDFPEYFL
jgi:hypothetical protein